MTPLEILAKGSKFITTPINSNPQHKAKLKLSLCDLDYYSFDAGVAETDTNMTNLARLEQMDLQ